MITRSEDFGHEYTKIIGDDNIYSKKAYYNGYSDGKNIVLFYKQNGVHKRQIIKDFEWYFYIDINDVKKLTSQDIKTLKYRKFITDIDSESNPRYAKIFTNKRIYRGEEFNNFNENFENVRVGKVDKELFDYLINRGVTPLEGDLTPLHRFIVDNNIIFETKLNNIYIDIETDDTLGGFDDKSIGKYRILSIGFSDEKGNKDILVVNNNDDESEREILVKFLDVLHRYDCIIAWNSVNFDAPFLRRRYLYHNIKVYWEQFLWDDLMLTFKRHYLRARSYSLDNISFEILNERKVKNPYKKIIDLYTNDRNKFIEYNLKDIDLLHRLSINTGFRDLDVSINTIGGCFSNSRFISQKLDFLMLRIGRVNNYHFNTKFKVNEESDGSSFEGAYIMEPIRGLHNSICNLDFKSLYPSIITTFNISYETYIENPSNTDSLIKTPINTYFVKNKTGYVPHLLKVTLKERDKYQKLQIHQDPTSTKFYLYKRMADAYKVLGLSLFGEMGNIRSRYFKRDVARTISLTGQYFTKATIKFAEKLGYKTIYSDTDSCMMNLSVDEAKVFIQKVQSLYDSIVKHFNANESSIELEFKGFFDKVLFLRKKKYAALVSLYKDKKVDYIDIKGLECIRSDGLEYARKLQYDIIEKILRKSLSIKDIESLLRLELKKLEEGKVPKESLAIYQSVTKDPDKYKGSLVHVDIARDLIKKGKEFYIGMKIPYIITSYKPKIAGVHLDDFEGKIDIQYYWSQKIFPSIKRVLEIAYPDYDWAKLERTNVDLLFEMQRPKTY